MTNKIMLFLLMLLFSNCEKTNSNIGKKLNELNWKNQISVAIKSVLNIKRLKKYKVIKTLIQTINKKYLLKIDFNKTGEYETDEVDVVMKIINDNRITYSDTFYLFDPEDLYLDKHKQHIIVEKWISTISYHQFILIDTLKNCIMKSNEFDRNVKFKSITYKNNRPIFRFLDITNDSVYNEEPIFYKFY